MSYGAVSAVNRGALMQIFLSYASEDKAVAEPIAFSLRARGHKVFLDRDDLVGLDLRRAAVDADQERWNRGSSHGRGGVAIRAELLQCGC